MREAYAAIAGYKKIIKNMSKLPRPFEPRYLLFVYSQLAHLSQHSFCILIFWTLN
jgi:hypothetical protein